MSNLRSYCAILLIVFAAGPDTASAQSALDAVAPASKMSWSDALFEAVRQGWIESRGNVYECSQRLREERKLRPFSWREQSQFLAKCRKEREPVASGRGSTFADVKIWTQGRWNALKAHWRQDRERFRQCSTELKEISKLNKLSLHDERDFLYQCMNEWP